MRQKDLLRVLDSMRKSKVLQLAPQSPVWGPIYFWTLFPKMFREDARDEACGHGGVGQSGCKGTEKNRHCVSSYKNVTSFVANRAAKKAHVGNPGEGAALFPVGRPLRHSVPWSVLSSLARLTFRHLTNTVPNYKAGFKIKQLAKGIRLFKIHL